MSQLIPEANPKHAPQGERALRILVAEDDHVNQYLSRRVLARCGFFVHIVDNGKQAVEAMLDQHFDVILLDLLMPLMDGLEAAALIRENEKETGRRVPIIAVSSYDPEESEKGADVDAYIDKPIVLAELLDVMERLIGCSLDHP